MTFSQRAMRLRTAVAAALMLVYVLPVYWPPEAAVLSAPSAGASLMERLFPVVAPWWTALRLAALAAGAILLAPSVAGAVELRAAGCDDAPTPPKAAVTAAACFALVHLAAALAVVHAGRHVQLAYLAAGLVPSVILFAAPPAGWRRLRLPRGPLVALCVLAATWLVLRVVPAWHSPRAASATDMWLNLEWLLESARSGRNLLASRSELSATDAWMLLAGVGFLGPSSSVPVLPFVLTVNAVWLLVGALGLAALCRAVGDAWGSVVAAAAYLFSPLCLLLAGIPAPFGIPLGIGAMMLVALWRFVVHRSVSAFLGFAALAGIGATQLHLLHASLLGMAAALVFASRTPRVGAALVATALCVFLAPTAPSLPQLPALDDVRSEYVSRRWQWAGLESVLHEQRGLQRQPTLGQLMSAGERGPFDIQIGTLLLPFAAPRTALRLTGDVLFEPLSASVAAAGIAGALLLARSSRVCAGALALLAASLLPSLAGSQYDRISLTRAILLPISLGVFTAMAFAALARALPPRVNSVAALAAAVLIAASGCFVFDAVNPRILSTSAMELVLEVRDLSQGPRMAVITGNYDRNVDWLHVERTARYLPVRPLEVVRFAGAADLTVPRADAADVFLWSPGIEEDASVSKAVCALLPSAALFELRSRSGLSRAYAAARDGAGWQPPLEPARWSKRACAADDPSS